MTNTKNRERQRDREGETDRHRGEVGGWKRKGEGRKREDWE